MSGSVVSVPRIPKMKVQTADPHCSLVDVRELAYIANNSWKVFRHSKPKKTLPLKHENATSVATMAGIHD